MATTNSRKTPSGRYAPGSVLTLVPWGGSLLLKTNGVTEPADVIAWATVVTHYDDNGDLHSHIEPVIRHEGAVHTAGQLRKLHGDDCIVRIY
ncbi:hypothetical protein ACWEP8_07400 [Streptomyces hydrogenans]